MFDYRHRIVAQDLKMHAENVAQKTLNVAVTGSGGLVGSALCPFLTTGGHRVLKLVRSVPDGESEVRWDPKGGNVDADRLEGVDAVVHLAGENIAGARWNDAQKERIRDSRVRGTRLLAESLAGLERRPEVLVCASAVGFYGDRGDEVLDEGSSAGRDFLADVCREWEAAAEPARAAGIRVVHLRFGAILSPAGGALAKMLLPFKLGAGGRLGSGRQYMSWIALDDVVGVAHRALVDTELSGPVNTVAPNPVTNAEFTRVLGRVLGRPTILPMPAFAARLAFGEMADELLLASQRVRPGVLEDAGHGFQLPELEGALRHLLGRRA